MPAIAADPDEKSFDPIKEGRRILRALKRAEGGAYTPAEACALLGITRTELKAKVLAKELFSWGDNRGVARLPKWQFHEGNIRPGIAACLAVLGDDPAGHLQFFLTPAPYSGGLSPLELLRQGRLDEALTIAREVSGS